MGVIVLLPMLESRAEHLFETVTVAPSDYYRSNAYPTVDRLADGRLLCVFTAEDPKTENKHVVAGAFSADHGKTWSDSYEIPMPHRYTCGKVNRGIRLKNGRLLFGYSWDRGLEATSDRLFGEGHHDLVAGVMMSEDEGRSWQAGGDVRLADRGRAPDRPDAIHGVDEPALVECHDGSVYMLCRTGRERLYESRSRDGGKSWSAPEASSLTSHNAPPALCRFEGDRPGLLAVWCRSSEHRWPLCAAASYDDGRTWTRARELARHEGFQSSYPGCIQAADGTLVAVWQQDEPGGRRRIASARFTVDWLRNEGGVEARHPE